MQTPPRPSRGSPPTSPNGKKRKREPPNQKLRYHNARQARNPDFNEYKLLHIMPDFAYYEYGFDGYKMLLEAEANDDEYTSTQQLEIRQILTKLVELNVRLPEDLLRLVAAISINMSEKVRQHVLNLMTEFTNVIFSAAGQSSATSDSKLVQLRLWKLCDYLRRDQRRDAPGT